MKILMLLLIKYSAVLKHSHKMMIMTMIEREYEIAMKRLEDYYGNPFKVVRCVKRVESRKSVAEGGYKSLLLYCL